MSVLFGLSMLLALAGCMLIYLASRHQLWWQHHRDPILLRRGGLSLLGPEPAHIGEHHATDCWPILPACLDHVITGPVPLPRRAESAIEKKSE